MNAGRQLLIDFPLARQREPLQRGAWQAIVHFSQIIGSTVAFIFLELVRGALVAVRAVGAFAFFLLLRADDLLQQLGLVQGILAGARVHEVTLLDWRVRHARLLFHL